MVPVPVLSKSWKATMKRPSGAHNTDSNARNSWNEISLSPTVCLVEGGKKTTKKTMLNIYIITVIAEFMPLIQSKQPELSPHIDSHQWHVEITETWFDPTEIMPKRFWRENKNTVTVNATIAIKSSILKSFNSDHYAYVVCTCVTQHPPVGVSGAIGSIILSTSSNDLQYRSAGTL